jgi:hypothetical protein
MLSRVSPKFAGQRRDRAAGPSRPGVRVSIIPSAARRPK